MAYQAYVSIRGSKQGMFKGNSSKKAMADKWIEVFHFEMTVASPRDVSTGQATGKRAHKPIRFAIETSTATQQLMSALVNNETLLNVNFEFHRKNAEGSDYVYYTITLTDASVARVGVTESNRAGRNHDVHEWSDVELTFGKITTTSTEPIKTSSDDWTDH